MSIIERFDTSSIPNPDAKRVADSWLAQRNLNRMCYDLIPQDKLDYNLAEGFSTPRESLTYQIRVHDNLLKCLREGTLIFGKHYKELQLEGLTKDELLQRFDAIDKDIINELVIGADKAISVPWKNNNPASLAEAVSSLRDNEVYHMQLNRSMLRVLGIPEPEELKRMWG